MVVWLLPRCKVSVLRICNCAHQSRAQKNAWLFLKEWTTKWESNSLITRGRLCISYGAIWNGLFIPGPTKVSIFTWEPLDLADLHELYAARLNRRSAINGRIRGNIDVYPHRYPTFGRTLNAPFQLKRLRSTSCGNCI